MKKLFVLILFMSLSPFGKSIFAENSYHPNPNLSMTLENQGCTGNQRCFNIIASGGEDGSYVEISVNGKIRAASRFGYFSTTICLDTQDSPYNVNFSCANEFQQDGCIVTIDPC